MVTGRLQVVTGRSQVGYRWVAGRLHVVADRLQVRCRSLEVVTGRLLVGCSR